MRMFSGLLALTILVAGAVLADEAATEAEIDYLIETVAESDCTFIRNGKEHDADDASDHLAMKRRRGKRYFDTADEFIERIASRSSWSGKPYRIRCENREVDAADWFTELLGQYRRDASAGDGG